MVRVLMSHKFSEQKVFSDAYEPTAIAYSISRDFVFVTTAEAHVYVYSLIEDGFPLLYQFPLLSVATQLIFSDTGDFVLSKEMTRKEKTSHFTARVYYNWSKWCEKLVHQKAKIVQLGFSLGKSFALEPNVLTTLQVQTDVQSLACCRVSSNLAVATECKVSVYTRCIECPFDFQKLYTVEAGYSVDKVVLCEQFVAFTSGSELRVLHISLQEPLQECLSKHREEDVLKASYSSCSQREVLDQDFVVWSFESDSFCDEQSELALLKDEVPFIDYSQDACEVLGPVNNVHGHPIKVQAPRNDVHHLTMLYQYFPGDSEEIHSLHLMPFYARGFNDKQTPQMSGMTCFVSSPNKGSVYNVFKRTQLVAQCTYATETTAAVICDNLLHAVTNNSLETYLLPVYAAVAKDIRQNLNDVPIAELDTSLGNNIASGVSSYHPSDAPKKFTHFGFPVYDLEMLQQPCPSPSADLCLIGIHPFTGLSCILAAGSKILLLSHTKINRSPKKHTKKSKEKNERKDWTLHVLSAMRMKDLFEHMESLSGENLKADLRLLKEQHFILRCQFQVNCDVTERQSLLALLRSSAQSIGEYYARYATDDVTDVTLYYSMADLSVEEILDQHIPNPIEVDKLKNRKFGNGLLCYLDNIFFKKNQDNMCITLPQITADKVLFVYYNAEPTHLSTLILRPLLEGYQTELAIKLLLKLKKTKAYSFSSKDHLALAVAYLRICLLDEAMEQLLLLTKEKLAEICVKHHYMLNNQDDTLSPLAQLLRKRLPTVFVKTLFFLHIRGMMSFANTIHLFQVADVSVHNNVHLLEFLELLLNDSKGKNSFKEARELLVCIYLDKLAEKSASQDRDSLRQPHHHIPRGSGHFAKRMLWLEKLPPFDGCMAEPKDCPIVRANMAAVSSQTSEHKYRGFSSKARQTTASNCKCCCCWNTLLKLQSLLCSRFCDEELGSFVLTHLVGKSLPGQISITLLCLPLIGEYHKAVETLLLIDSSILLSYGKHYFGKSYIKWQSVLDILYQKLLSEGESKKNEKFVKIFQETLLILSRCTTPAVFFSLLPENANFAFFLPYIVECCRNDSGKSLANYIHAR